MDWQRTPLRGEHLIDLVLPGVQVLPVDDREVKLLQQRTRHGAHLRHGDVLARTDHRTQRERREGLTACHDLVRGDDGPRRESVGLLRQPTVGPERLSQRREVRGVPVQRVGDDGDLGVLGNKAANDRQRCDGEMQEEEDVLGPDHPPTGAPFDAPLGAEQ